MANQDDRDVGKMVIVKSAAGRPSRHVGGRGGDNSLTQSCSRSTGVVHVPLIATRHH